MSYFSLFIQCCYLVVWGLVFVGGVIFLRRGHTNGAMSVLFGTGILMVVEILFIAVMVLTSQKLIGVAGGVRRMYQIMWVSQVLGALLFASGFLQLARTTQREM